MPATSQKQFRFMKAIEEEVIRRKGLSAKKAKEFTKNVDYKKLPKEAK